MIGYHYTTKENWEKIQVEGLIPQVVTSPGLLQGLEQDWGSKLPEIRGIWTWERPQVGIQGMGHVMLIHDRHKSENIVELSFEYDLDKDTYVPKKVPEYPRRYLQIWHDGTLEIGKYKGPYHKNEPVRLVTEPIAPERITLIQQYDFAEVKRQLMIHFDSVDTSA